MVEGALLTPSTLGLRLNPINPNTRWMIHTGCNIQDLQKQNKTLDLSKAWHQSVVLGRRCVTNAKHNWVAILYFAYWKFKSTQKVLQSWQVGYIFLNWNILFRVLFICLIKLTYKILHVKMEIINWHFRDEEMFFKAIVYFVISFGSYLVTLIHLAKF